MKYLFKLILAFIILLTFSSNIYAKSETAELFSNAKELYKDGKYKEVAKTLKNYLKKHGKAKETEEIVPLLIETLVRLNDYKYFTKLSKIYLEKFPNSVYLSRLYYQTGIVSAKKGDYKKAVIAFSESIKKSNGSDLDSLIPLNIINLCNSHLTTSDLKELQAKNLEQSVKKIIQSYISSSPKSKLEFTKRGGGNFRKNNFKIGLLAPITGNNKDLGNIIMQTVKIAIDGYNRTAANKIELIIEDTKGDMVTTAIKTRKLVDIDEVSVIIGPILSATATVAASAIMDRKDVVLLTPTATDYGIAGLGPNIFQLNITLGVLGKKIARYAVENLSIKEFAILAPMSKYGDILTHSFKEEVKHLGASVIAEEFYNSEANDYRPQFESIREKLAERKWATLKESDSLFGQNSKDQNLINSYLKDSTISIGGLFIPAETDDAAKLASQTYFHRIKTQILGSNGWDNSATILDGKQYVQNVLLSTGLKNSGINQKFNAFQSLYQRKMGTAPDRIAAPLAYDATNILLNAMTNSRDTREIANAISKVKTFYGVSGIISFSDGNGANSEAAIMKIDGKKFIRVQ